MIFEANRAWAETTGDPSCRPDRRATWRALREHRRQFIEAIPAAWADYQTDLKAWQAGDRKIRPSFDVAQVRKRCESPLPKIAGPQPTDGALATLKEHAHRSWLGSDLRSIAYQIRTGQATFDEMTQLVTRPRGAT